MHRASRDPPREPTPLPVRLAAERLSNSASRLFVRSLSGAVTFLLLPRNLPRHCQKRWGSALHTRASNLLLRGLNTGPASLLPPEAASDPSTSHTAVLFNLLPHRLFSYAHRDFIFVPGTPFISRPHTFAATRLPHRAHGALPRFRSFAPTSPPPRQPAAASARVLPQPNKSLKQPAAPRRASGACQLAGPPLRGGPMLARVVPLVRCRAVAAGGRCLAPRR
jgi:hypothetical protein